MDGSSFVETGWSPANVWGRSSFLDEYWDVARAFRDCVPRAYSATLRLHLTNCVRIIGQGVKIQVSFVNEFPSVYFVLV